jgi:L-fuconolactonase
MIFDAHAHIASADRVRYPPAPLSGALRPGDLDDPVTAERLLRLLDRHQVERAVLVQRAHIYGYDNSYVVDAAERYPDRFRALCMIDPLDPEAPERIRHWVTERGAVGIRMTEPYQGADTSWLHSPRASAAWEAAAALRVPIRLHLYRWNRVACLAAIAQVLPRFPHATIVLDHLSNLAAEEGAPSYGFDAALRPLRESANVLLLFSTINLAKLAAQQLPAAPVIEHLTREFGAHRIMWGSDIGQSQGAYREMCALADAAVSALDRADRRRVLYTTGRAVYDRADMP